MRYIVITTDPLTGHKEAFKTNWFEAENHYNPDYQMVVIDLSKDLVTFDGETWDDIESDHL